MSVILLALGFLIAGAGVATIGFAIPINASPVGQAMIIAGATALVGGPILVGLAAAVGQLAEIAAALKGKPAMQPVARLADARQPAELQRRGEAAPPPAPVEPRTPEPRPVEARPAEPAPATTDASASAIERLRTSMGRPGRIVTNGEDVPLSPNGGYPPAAPEPRPEPAARAGAGSEPEPREPRLDFLFRAKSPRPASSAQIEAFDAMWPKRGARPAPEPPRTDEVRRQPAAPAAGEERLPPPAALTPEQRSVAILKSGVVDGMAYTLYADGSIEAQLPHGTVRFGSIAELRDHIENNS